MLKLEIYEDPAKAGEICWLIRLIDKDGKTVLCSEDPLRKGEIVAIAKEIRHEGSTADLLDKEDETGQKGIWFEAFQNENDGWCLYLRVAEKCTLVSATVCASKEELEKLFETVKNEIKEAEIVWNPPDADPAKREKDHDRTEPRGIPGS